MNHSGLSSAEVAEKVAQGRTNRVSQKSSNSIGKIILRNTLTIFNIVNLILATMVLLVGSYKHLLFIFIAIANTLISIINEVRAKRTIDKMRLLSEQKPTVIRDGKPVQIRAEDIVEGDLIVLSIGDQILVDSKIASGTVEVNESFITGESSNITKHPGDRLTSGSFVVSGTCKATATAVGADNFINKLESSAYTIKTANSKLFTLMNNIVKYISYALIPIGVLLLWARFRVPGTTTEVAVTSTVAALINMIPEGLILLTSSVLALATIRLGRQKVLVQDLYSVETLARVDCICLDKTGTLTTGKMRAVDMVPAEGQSQNALQTALTAILSHSSSDTATSLALKEELLLGTNIREMEGTAEEIPFSSDRKYSGVRIGDTEYLMGAAEFVTSDEKSIAMASELSGEYRVITVIKRTYSKAKTGKTSTANKKLADDTASEIVLGFVLLKDELRRDAHEIIDYFYHNDISIKIISGDNLTTVENIATQVGIKDIQGVDLSTIKGKIKYTKLVKDYNIFTRVKPAQKKELILALKKQGNTVAMTGDGVNDILAMKEADCSIAIGEGSDAARRSAKLVLLDSDFAAVPSIIDEGRQSINNLERSTALFLAKTVYASILAVVFVILPMEYPFTPIEMSLLNFACIGFPGLVLALEHNTDRIKNSFTKNILTYSFPVGLTVSFCMAALSIVSHIQGFSHPELTTISVFVTFTIDLVLIYWISRPLNELRAGLLIAIIGIMVAAFAAPLIRDFFEFVILTPANLIVMAIIIGAGLIIFELMRRLMRKLTARIFDNNPRLTL
ncbi:HAD-IC family P-type ATPase [Candidatus Saccharibacteria bacterium]|nr:HAD-IC family P-type ATPase [Candidatus Saccharibacteria bacterium]